MALELPTGTYGNLADLAPLVGIPLGTLKVARHRHPDRFPTRVGTIGRSDVYALDAIIEYVKAAPLADLTETLPRKHGA